MSAAVNVYKEAGEEGRQPLILLFIPINTIFSMGACTVGGGMPASFPPPVLPYTLSPLDAVCIILFMVGGA